jgi:hypothetical protein
MLEVPSERLGLFSISRGYAADLLKYFMPFAYIFGDAAKYLEMRINKKSPHLFGCDKKARRVFHRR